MWMGVLKCYTEIALLLTNISEKTNKPWWSLKFPWEQNKNEKNWSIGYLSKIRICITLLISNYDGTFVGIWIQIAASDTWLWPLDAIQATNWIDYDCWTSMYCADKVLLWQTTIMCNGKPECAIQSGSQCNTQRPLIFKADCIHLSEQFRDFQKQHFTLAWYNRVD